MRGIAQLFLGSERNRTVSADKRAISSAVARFSAIIASLMFWRVIGADQLDFALRGRQDEQRSFERCGIQPPLTGLVTGTDVWVPAALTYYFRI